MKPKYHIKWYVWVDNGHKLTEENWKEYCEIFNGFMIKPTKKSAIRIAKKFADKFNTYFIVTNTEWRGRGLRGNKPYKVLVIQPLQSVSGK